MRLAFCGTHRAGKTALVEALSESLPSYEVVEEPYRVLEEEGYELADPPCVEDFERQLRLSIELLAAAPANALFDRCPLDFVGYLQALDEDFDVADYMDDVRDSIASLDLIVVVPIETPDRISVPSHEDHRLRRLVDQRLKHLVLDDPFGLDAATLEVSGSLPERVRAVLRAIE
jgi:hypothetical protein